MKQNAKELVKDIANFYKEPSKFKLNFLYKYDEAQGILICYAGNDIIRCKKDPSNEGKFKIKFYKDDNFLGQGSFGSVNKLKLVESYEYENGKITEYESKYDERHIQQKRELVMKKVSIRTDRPDTFDRTEKEYDNITNTASLTGIKPKGGVLYDDDVDQKRKMFLTQYGGDSLDKIFSEEFYLFNKIQNKIEQYINGDINQEEIKKSIENIKIKIEELIEEYNKKINDTELYVKEKINFYNDSINILNDVTKIIKNKKSKEDLKLLINYVGINEHKAKIACGLIESVQEMNSNGYLHRDIKPANLTINNSGKIRLIDVDFMEKIDDLNKKTSLRGTHFYIEPRIMQLRGTKAEYRIKKNDIVYADKFAVIQTLLRLYGKYYPPAWNSKEGYKVEIDGYKIDFSYNPDQKKLEYGSGDKTNDKVSMVIAILTTDPRNYDELLSYIKNYTEKKKKLPDPQEVTKHIEKIETLKLHEKKFKETLEKLKELKELKDQDNEKIIDAALYALNNNPNDTIENRMKKAFVVLMYSEPTNNADNSEGLYNEIMTKVEDKKGKSFDLDKINGQTELMKLMMKDGQMKEIFLDMLEIGGDKKKNLLKIDDSNVFIKTAVERNAKTKWYLRSKRKQWSKMSKMKLCKSIKTKRLSVQYNKQERGIIGTIMKTAWKNTKQKGLKDFLLHLEKEGNTSIDTLREIAEHGSYHNSGFKFKPSKALKNAIKAHENDFINQQHRNQISL